MVITLITVMMMIRRSDYNGYHSLITEIMIMIRRKSDYNGLDYNGYHSLITVMMMMMRSDNNGYHCDDDHKDEDVTAAFITIVITL